MDKIGIYCFTNKINGKKYVGQSKQLNRRYHMHITDALNPDKAKRDTSIFHAAIRKYGIENFDYEILEECEISQLNEKEQYWIQKLHSYVLENGYNLTIGGNNNLRDNYYFSSEDLLHYWNDLKLTVTAIYQTYGSTGQRIREQLLELGITQEEIDKRTYEKRLEIVQKGMPKRLKKINQYDLDGNFIQSFNSLTEAANAVNGSKGNISQVANGKYQTAYGYKWKYDDLLTF